MKAIHPTTLVILFICTALSSCIEFESQDLVYHHDNEKDELRVTLTYEGIFGNLDKGEYSRKNRNDVATHNSLNQLQIDQLESVLKEKRAFFFSNWIFEYSASSSTKMLEKIIKGNGQGKFGEPERKLIKLLLDNIEVQNIGFYKNNADQLCGSQTVRISNVSAIIPLANQVIGRLVKAHIQEMREEREEKVPNSFTTETINLIETKVRDGFPYIKIQGNLITITLIMTTPDQERISKSTLKDLPEGARIEFQDEALLIKIGTNHAQQSRLSKKCFEGYWPNALNHIQANHKKMIRKPRKVESRLKKFLSGTD